MRQRPEGGRRIALSYMLFSLSRMCSFTVSCFWGKCLQNSKHNCDFYLIRCSTVKVFHWSRNSRAREKRVRSSRSSSFSGRSACYQREHRRERDIPELDNDFSRLSCVDGYFTTATKSASPRSSTAPTTVSRTWQTALDLHQAWNETYVVTTR